MHRLAYKALPAEAIVSTTPLVKPKMVDTFIVSKYSMFFDSQHEFSFKIFE